MLTFHGYCNKIASASKGAFTRGHPLMIITQNSLLQYIWNKGIVRTLGIKELHFSA